MESFVSMDGVNTTERSARLLEATEVLVYYLKDRFPASQGYSYKMKERLAEWAPSLDKSARDTETRKRAFGRTIRIKKGMNWGLDLNIQTTDRDMSGVKVFAESASPLAKFLGGAGFFVGMAAYKVVLQIKGRGMSLPGLASGVVFGLFGGWIGIQFESLTQDQVKEIIDASTEIFSQSFVTGG